MANVIIGRCATCKHWTREKSIINREEIPFQYRDMTIGTCAVLGCNISYWCSENEAEKVIQPANIGCNNLWTNEMFGCVQHEPISNHPLNTNS